MDRNNIIGLILIFIIFGGSFYLMKPSEAEIKLEQARQDSIAMAKNGVVVNKDTSSQTAVLDSAALAQPFGAAKVAQEELITLENDVLKIDLTSKGGKVKNVLLKGETNFDGSALNILEGDNNKFGFIFKAAGENINTNDLVFSVVNKSANAVTFRLNYKDNQYIEYVYNLTNGHNLALNVNAIGIQNLVDVQQKTILIDWEATLLQKEQNIKSEREKSSIFFKESNGDIDYLSESSDDEEKIDENKIEWIAFKQHFFSSIFSSKQQFENTNLVTRLATQDGVVKTYKATAELAFNAQANNHYEFNYFFGPNK